MAVELAKKSDFSDTTSLSSRLLSERYDLELLLRFFLLKDMSQKDLDKLKDVDLSTFLTEHMAKMAESTVPFEFEKQAEVFDTTFRLLNKSLGDEAFKKYDAQKSRFLGSFTVSGFEAVALGIGSQLSGDMGWSPSYDLAARVKDIWSRDDFTRYVGSGVSSSSRIPKVVPFGRTFFAN